MLITLTILVCGAYADEIEISYDDGTPEGYGGAGSETGVAVRFTPPSYPTKIVAVKLYLFELSTDCGGGKVWVVDDDGLNETPGSSLFGPVSLGVIDSTGWLELEIPEESQITISDGEFYICRLDSIDPRDCTSIGLDDSATHADRQWFYGSGIWVPFPEPANFMIRALVVTGSVPVELVSWGSLKASM
ncbi:MAG: hypothetical protein KJ970_09285 [Candidatus Eisenbacteria bacterium]|uniref:Uncharacterized protein n=1 Tax=Eiseniibacteriota bacterium TaxID=2212470 RepID=A0A948RW78_UNCEI|nr:hypothetical protein [Candidatus Eisenbacteria bacterium]